MQSKDATTDKSYGSKVPFAAQRNPRNIVIAEDFFGLSKVTADRLTRVVVNSVEKLYGKMVPRHLLKLYVECCDELAISPSLDVVKNLYNSKVVTLLLLQKLTILASLVPPPQALLVKEKVN